MITKGFMLIDGSNLGFAATYGQVLKAGDMEVQGIFKLLRKLRDYIDRFPTLKPIVLWDGASWRHKFYAEYKAGRIAAKPETPKELEAAHLRASFLAQRPFMQQMLTSLGVTQMHAMNLEADDLAALLVRKKATPDNRIVLLSADKDWMQLVGERVAWIDPINKRKVPITTLRTFKDSTGVLTPRQFLELKALVGDTSDNLPGVGGIGDKGAIALLEVFGSVAAFQNQWIDKTIKDKLPKKFRDFAESADKQHVFRRNMMLMDLNSPEIPAPDGLTIIQQKLDHLLFDHHCRSFAFKSILDTRDEWVGPFTRMAA